MALEKTKTIIVLRNTRIDGVSVAIGETVTCAELTANLLINMQKAAPVEPTAARAKTAAPKIKD